MFIESLTITCDGRDIRHITFHKGLNLIVDDTAGGSETGNDVGKTTLLRLIDFCLGLPPGELYKDPENSRTINTYVKEFLTERNVEVTLMLVDNLDIPARKIEIRRNFQSGRKAINMVQGIELKKEAFIKELSRQLFPELRADRPTFRQLISHNIRYKDIRLGQTLRTLDKFVRDEDYQTLHLFMFGCPTDESEEKAELSKKCTEERRLLRRMEKHTTKGDCQARYDLLTSTITALNSQKDSLCVNPDLEHDISRLDKIRGQLNDAIHQHNTLTIRKKIITDTMAELRAECFETNLQQLHAIYQQASSLQATLARSFDEMVAYHNAMLRQRAMFVESELPALEEEILKLDRWIGSLHTIERQLSGRITASATFESLEDIIRQLNEAHRQRGQYEEQIAQIEEQEQTVRRLQERLSSIEHGLYSPEFAQIISSRIQQFNNIFSNLTQQLYAERLAIAFDTRKPDGTPCYKFHTIDAQISTGKKQGEIACFDIAYTLFADTNRISCLHFLLHDKSELVHDNQLRQLADIVSRSNAQYIMPILADKLPPEINTPQHIILRLSQQDKLLRIENEEDWGK